MKLLKKLFTGLLGLMMVFTCVHATSMTANAEETVEKPRTVFSIDAGRKYFSADQLKRIIDKAYNNGYSDVQILLGNDGLRFLLDDMTITVNGKTYASDDVKAAVLDGNAKYAADVEAGDIPNSALTETEMNDILSFAKERHINIIPVINSPGHMDAILYAMETLGFDHPQYSTSKRTVDLKKTDAVAFTQALIKKYAEYFGSKGTSDIFNFGCDEYANDATGGEGWNVLQDTGDYPKFVEYVNSVSKIIKDAGMRPMAFNDGIYYRNKTDAGVFDKDLIVSYWTAGWWHFEVAKPKFLQDKGHDILNTNDGWYYVVGVSGKDGYSYENALQRIDERAFDSVPGDDGQKIKTIGSMQAVWCDFPGNTYEEEKVFNLMDKFSTVNATKMDKPADYSKVDAELAKVPTDLSVYTDETVAKLNAELAKIDHFKRASEQETVNGYVKVVQNAIGQLSLKPEEGPIENKGRAVFSIDAGRKYFSADQLKRIIDKAYNNGYSDVQILLGNDALRFFLDDMSVEANGKTYASDDVKAAILKGNDKYAKEMDAEGIPNTALTESEMDEILAYAKAHHINVIPVINSPGHMDSILTAMETLGIEHPQFKTSTRTVDFDNEAAVAFTQTLIGKYITYFGSKGASDIFNIGTDEYANDVQNGGGWQALQDAGKYNKLVEYVNALSAKVKEAGMRPMCFNDGIYYNSTEEFGKFDKDLIISYWTSGWWGYDVAKPKFFVEKGHEILNTNDGWYYVLGNNKADGTLLNGNPYTYSKAIRGMETKRFTDVTGAPAGETVPSIGSMQCVWADYPGEEYVESDVFALMDKYAYQYAAYLNKPTPAPEVTPTPETTPAPTVKPTAKPGDSTNKVESGKPSTGVNNSAFPYAAGLVAAAVAFVLIKNKLR